MENKFVIDGEYCIKKYDFQIEDWIKVTYYLSNKYALYLDAEDVLNILDGVDSTYDNITLRMETLDKAGKVYLHADVFFACVELKKLLDISERFSTTEAERIYSVHLNLYKALSCLTHYYVDMFGESLDSEVKDNDGINIPENTYSPH